ncbi:MAG: helix-turn-helix domain-containing protein [Actinomycetaceae bacterium]|nr:helix-turn-helix domain-containing protein [Actinomycetaceae bacterium]
MTVDRRSRGAYAAGLATREAILDAAMRLVARSGYRGFSLRDLGREVGLSHPAVIYHFPSKEILLTNVVKRYEDMLGIFSIDIDDDGHIVENGLAVSSIFEWAVQLMRLEIHPQTALLQDLGCVVTVEAASLDHPAHDHVVYRYGVTREFLTAELTQIQNDGLMTFPVAPSAMVESMLRDWNGMAIHARFHNQGTDEEEVPTGTVSDYLAVTAQSMELPAQYILDLGALVPEDVAEVFSSALRRYREIRS